MGVGAGAFLNQERLRQACRGAACTSDALQELGESLENEVAPRVFSLDDRTITLTGSVEEQYAQWKDISG